MCERVRTPIVAALLLIFVAAGPLSAASREQQQLMADIRMLQEQAQQLQALIADLTSAVKAVSARLDDQSALTRKAFADEKVLVDNVSGDVRVVREKVDETNVRLSSLSQELEALRVAIPQANPAAADAGAADGPLPAGDTATGAPPAAPVPPAAASPGMSPQRLYDTAWADYTAGQWSLAIQGFETYLRTFPKSDLADEAQYYVGDTYFNDSKFDQAVAAYDRVIANYPNGNMVPQAYYKRGLAYERLGQADRARQSYDVVMKNYPESDAGRLAKQAIDRLNRPSR
jgi:tol-pal system protein YbgF